MGVILTLPERHAAGFSVPPEYDRVPQRKCERTDVLRGFAGAKIPPSNSPRRS
jgi:hypothetical protein